MIEIDQYTAINSLDKALIPGDHLIDGRNEADMLDFLSGFAGLINFYNNSNKINGNWEPFLLKDPVFIVASIAKTRYTNIYELYHKTCLYIEQLLKKDAAGTELPSALNTLFDQVTSLFFIMEHWTYYMQSSDEEYDLKSFVTGRVRYTYSAIFWAVQAMREDLYLHKAIPFIDPVKYYLFDRFDSLIWRVNMNKSPYWQVLGINKPIADPKSEITHAKENKASCYKALRYAGDQALSFIKTTIRFAPAEFEKLNATRGRYPDTILLRTFIHLLQVQQKQLNGISGRHLEFYYRDILKQKELPAKADHVFVCAQVSTPAEVFFTDAGTLFNAGEDAQKNPILFANAEPVTLNPAAIAGCYTLAVAGIVPALYSKTVYINDGSGQVVPWETFGDAAAPATQQKTAFVVASPMLYLKEGLRTIVFTLNFAEAVPMDLLTGATYYLTTQKAWLKLDPPAIAPVNNMPPLFAYSITVMLDPTKEAIVPFLEKPVDMESVWPMLKIEFDTAANLNAPPVISIFTIDVTVSGIKNLLLNNDYGVLSTKTPYPPFGPSPPVNSNFIIGSSEIFSKPLTAVYMSLTWSTLPPDGFQDYYQLYNNCIRDNFVPPVQSVEQEEQLVDAKEQAELALPPAKDTLALPEGAPPKKNIFKRFFGAIGNGIKRTGRFFKNIVMAIVHFFAGIFKWIWKIIAGVFKAIGNGIAKIAKAIKDAATWLFRRREKKPAMIENEEEEEDADVPYNNVCFTVLFYLLQEQTWLRMPVKNEKDITVDESTNSITVKHYDHHSKTKCPKLVNHDLLLFKTTIIPADPPKPEIPCALTPDSYFAYFASKHFIQKADPMIQLTPLEFADSSAWGFIKMTLTAPVYGFGLGVYPMVVSDLTLQNAIIISSETPDLTKIQPAPNTPFTPLLASFVADYTASHTYSFSSNGQDYPLQCYLTSPFSTYKVYDTTGDWQQKNSPVPNSITGLAFSTNGGLPLLPAFDFQGSLFIGLSALVPSNVLNFYFELARNYSDSKKQDPAQYFYLGKNGWTLLPLLSDGTNNFSCSGIIKLYIPSDIVNNSPLMPGNNYWISIAAGGDLSAFSKIVYLNTNGFELKRSGNFYTLDNEVPELKSGAITKPQNPIPQIAAVEQPFPSFGGRAAENQVTMNRRVSNRIKTKDRVVSSEDYYRLINEVFKDVYYSEVVFDKEKLASMVYVVKAVASPYEPNAFVPLLTRCREEEIRKFLEKKASAFARIQVRNFNPEYISVTAGITLSAGYEGDSVVARVQNGINLYLSPWVAGRQEKAAIKQPISNSEMAAFIQTIEGVDSVNSVKLKSSLGNSYDVTNGTMPVTIYPSGASLFVSSLDHTIHYPKSR